MEGIFHKLLDNSIAEVFRREPSYPAVFPVNLSREEMLTHALQVPLCSQVPPQAVEQACQEGLTYMAGRWPKSEEASTGADPVVRFLCGCIVDAICADQGLLALRPHNGFNGSVREVLAEHYIQRSTPGGVRYYVRNGGRRPLLLIHATGTPIAIWNQFLADTTHDFKLIVPERRGCDLFQGRLQQHVTIETDSADLTSILDAEMLEQTDILAWCNGARVAIHLANSWMGRISSMVLVGPMLKGIRGVTANPSNFERDLQPLLDAVSKDSSLAPFLSKTIACQPISPDWNRLRNAPVARAQALFAMPAKEHAGGTVANLVEAESFTNIARRVASDESYPMDQALRNLRTPTMMIMGSDDGIVSNDLVSAAMKKMCTNPVVKVVLYGAGHYVHDLQYHYFRWLLDEFLVNHRPPPATARISVEDVTGMKME